MTIRVQLGGSGLAVLQQEAAALGVTVEQLATDILERHAGKATAARTIPDDKFRAVLADSLRENEELLRRLAK